MRPIKFHQGFRLDRARLATLLRCAVESEPITKKSAAVAMGVGEPAAEGCIGWLLKTGLGRAMGKGYAVTPLGALVAAHDPELSQRGTLWLLHYHLATEHAERAEVWFRAFNEFLTPAAGFTRAALQVFVERSLESTPANRSGLADDCTEFIKGYTAHAGLGKLELVREAGGDAYEAAMHQPPEPLVFAFALFDAWQRRFPHTDTLRVSQICAEPELPGRVFVAQREQIVRLLQNLQSLGLVNLVDSQHEPVTRRYREAPEQLITSFYASP